LQLEAYKKSVGYNWWSAGGNFCRPFLLPTALLI
jgi:hypothetical protein